MIAEGCARTRNLKRYLLRMLAGALLAEIPFDLMYGGMLFYPLHQNVLWTFLLSLLLIMLIEKCREKFRPVLAVPASAGLALFALLPIWLYQGRQGFHGKAFQFFCYAFYPVHMLLLFIPASNEPSAALVRAFGECREGQITRSLLRGI